MSLDSAIQHLLAAKRISNASQSYAKDNPGEWAKVRAYLEGGTRPTGVATEMGVGLIEVEDARRNVTPDPDPPPTNYPASYFTGPLGNNNVVPADPNGALYGLWSGGHGYDPTATRGLILKRIQDLGRTPDLIMHQQNTMNVGGVSSEAWVKSLGAMSVVDWGAGGAPGATGSQGTAIDYINSGAHDAVITADADRYKAHGDRIMFRLFHEFNGNWTNWSTTVAGAPKWIQAWRRVVGIFKTRGATNVGFVFCPTEGQAKDIAIACYPGDEWCDWTSTTSYNSCYGTADWCTPFHGGWATYREMIDYTSLGHSQQSTYTLFAGRKPFVQTECSSKGDPQDTNRKANWFRAIDSEGKQNMPNLRGIVFFDQDFRTSEGHDWRVDYDQMAFGTSVFNAASYQGFKDLVNKPRWNVGVA